MFKKLTTKLAPFSARELSINDMSFNCRLVQVADVPQLVKIEEAVYAGYAPWQADAFIHELMNQNGRQYLLLEKGHQIVAFIGLALWTKTQELHVTNVAVLPIWQSNGLGAQLLKIAQEITVQNQLEQLTLEVRESNTRAISFYQRLGFEIIELKEQYYLDDHENAWWMSWQNQ